MQVAKLEMAGVEKVKITAETQTVHEFIEIPCNECVYMASCQEELNFHLENDHDQEETEEPEMTDPNTFNICGKRNKNLRELSQPQERFARKEESRKDIFFEVVFIFSFFLGRLLFFI
jgi:hypothetical protein